MIRFLLGLIVGAWVGVWLGSGILHPLLAPGRWVYQIHGKVVTP